MTVDTATLRAQWEAIREQQGPEAFAIVAHVGDSIALLDALEAERERVRVLRAACEALARAHDLLGLMGAQLHAREALAAAGEEGAAT